MPNAKVIEAVEARLAARWSSPEAIAARRDKGLPEAPVLVINEDGDTPDDGSTFVQIQFPTGRTRQMDVAGKSWMEDGTIRIIVNTMSGSGTKEGTQLADLLATIFRGKKFDGVQTYGPQPPVIDDRNDQGMYWPVAFAVPYDFKFTDPGDQYD